MIKLLRFRRAGRKDIREFFGYLAGMIRLLLKLYWKLSGWKVVGQFPYQYKKMIIIVAPHTSWKDILVGLATRRS